MPLPPSPSSETLTLRRFIERVVREEVAAFRERQAERRFARALSAGQIAVSAAHGKVDMGGRDLQQEVDPDQAVRDALLAFTDGLYLVLIDGRQQPSQVFDGLGPRLLATKNVSKTSAEPQEICAPFLQFFGSHRPSSGLALLL